MRYQVVKEKYGAAARSQKLKNERVDRRIETKEILVKQIDEEISILNRSSICTGNAQRRNELIKQQMDVYKEIKELRNPSKLRKKVVYSEETQVNSVKRWFTPKKPK